ncbi:enoyl-CoA hydratase/isomerase family protein [Pseudonocardia sp. MCCB 268]|nr:enoyl-CoA hydratase/isomerase family protein [Pseudonocardia cytotoxica]
MTYIRTSRDGDDDRIAEVVLDRPGKLNALSGQMLDELSATLDKLGRDPSVSCILLRSPARSASATTSRQRQPARDRLRRLGEPEQEDRPLAPGECPKPVISAIRALHGRRHDARRLHRHHDRRRRRRDRLADDPTGRRAAQPGEHVADRSEAVRNSPTPPGQHGRCRAASLGWANRAVPAGECCRRPPGRRGDREDAPSCSRSRSAR